MSRIEEKRDGENAMIEMKDVMKKYSNGTTAIRNISVEIDQGEFVYVVGPSGAGKSTFIRLMYREEKATKGNLTVAGHDLMKIKIKKFLIYVVKSASFSKTINYYQRKLCMRTWPMRCKLSDDVLAKSKNA